MGLFHGPTAVGYFGWAFNYSLFSTEFATALNAINFSAFSRMAENREELAKILVGIIRGILMVGVPITLILIILAQSIVNWIYTPKWLPALPSVYAFAIFSLCNLIANPLSVFLLAQGKSKKVLKLSTIWIMLILLFSLTLIRPWGILGVASAYSLAACVAILCFLREVPLILKSNLWSAIKPIIVSSSIMGICLIGLQFYLNNSFQALLLLAFLGVAFYLGVLWIIDRGRVREEIDWSKKIAVTILSGKGKNL